MSPDPRDRDPWIDAAIASLVDIELPAELRRRVAQIPAQHKQGFVWPSFDVLRHAWAWTACAALGAVCGFVLDEQTSEHLLSLSNSNRDDGAISASEESSLPELAQLAWNSEWTLEMNEEELAQVAP